MSEGIERYLRNVFLPSEQLYAGDFSDALEQIKTARQPTQHPDENGADLIARKLISTV